MIDTIKDLQKFLKEHTEEEERKNIITNLMNYGFAKEEIEAIELSSNINEAFIDKLIKMRGRIFLETTGVLGISITESIEDIICYPSGAMFLTAKQLTREENDQLISNITDSPESYKKKKNYPEDMLI